MLDVLMELAKDTKSTKSSDENKNNEPGQRIEPPEWWKKLSPEGRDTYLRWHPRSKMTPFIKQEMRDWLKKHPQDRKKLRNVVKTIAKNPEKALAPDLHKLEKAAQRKPSKKDAEEITNDVEDAIKSGGKGTSILKAAGKALAIAGVLTIGGALVASGGLPYAILGIRMIKDTVELTRDVKDRIDKGQHAVKAVMTAVHDTIAKAARDPAVVASAIVISQQKAEARRRREEEGEKVTRAKTSGESDKDNIKTQGRSGNKQSTNRSSKQERKEQQQENERQVQKRKENQHDSNKINLDDEEGNA